MKKIILSLALLFGIMLNSNAQDPGHVSFSTYVGTAIDLTTPSYTPFTWHVLGHYNFNKRFSAGIGTGVSIYERTLIPVYADVRYNLTKPHKFVPYLECGSGYSFVTSKNANGGFYLNPSIGLKFAVCKNKSILLSIGYELQELERLKTYEDKYAATAFQEHLSHNSISFKMGYSF